MGEFAVHRDPEQGPAELPRDSLVFETSEFFAKGLDDPRARERLFERYGPRLQAFLHGRLPLALRSQLDTVDLAHDVWTRAFANLERFEHRGVGDFWGFLRRVANDRLTDVYRRAGARERHEPIGEGSSLQPASPEPTPSVRMMADEACLAFDRALEVVGERERNAVLVRLELERPWDEIAQDCGYPSADAARMAVHRALKLICEEMSRPFPRK